MTKRSYIDENGDALEADEYFFKHAKRGRPEMFMEQRKKPVTMRIDPEVLEYFKKEGKGWQTRVNAALRKAAGLPS